MVLSARCLAAAAAARWPRRRRQVLAVRAARPLDTFSGAVYADIQVRREAWSAMFVIFGLVDMGFSMTIDSAPPEGPSAAGLGSVTVVSPAPPSWPWRRAALFLAGTAHLITISALGRCRSRPSGLVVAAAGGCARAGGSCGGLRPGAAKSAGRGGRSCGPGRRHRRAGRPHQAVLCP